MSFRDDVRRAYDDLGEPAPYGFEQRVLARVRQAPERGRSDWFGPAVAFGLAVLLVLGIVLVRFGGTPRATRPAPAATQPAPAATQPALLASPSGAPSAQPSPTWTICGYSVPQEPAVNMPVTITAVRVGTDSSRDRFVVEFSGPVPPFELRRQDSSTFTQEASGRQVTLAGTAGWLLVIHGADEHTAYSGASDFVTGYPVLAEARNVGDFEGTVSWALGVNTAASCPVVSTLSGPSRLVIDFPR